MSRDDKTFHFNRTLFRRAIPWGSLNDSCSCVFADLKTKGNPVDLQYPTSDFVKLASWPSLLKLLDTRFSAPGKISDDSERGLPVGVNPLTSKISSVILLTVFHTVLVMLVWRIWDRISRQSPNWYFSLFSSLVCLTLYGYCKKKFCLGNSWELKC